MSYIFTRACTWNNLPFIRFWLCSVPPTAGCKAPKPLLKRARGFSHTLSQTHGREIPTRYLEEVKKTTRKILATVENQRTLAKGFE